MYSIICVSLLYDARKCFFLIFNEIKGLTPAELGKTNTKYMDGQVLIVIKRWF